MKLVVVTVPDCPNAPVLEQRLAQALAETGAGARVSIVRRTVADAEQAARLQMRGSPTLLIDGVDPFAEDSVPASLSCRMYRDEDGRLAGAPSVAALRRVLGPRLESSGDQIAGGPSPLWSGPLGRAGAGRVAPVAGGLRAVHQRVLRCFARTGRAPEEAELAASAQPSGRPTGQVAELHAADFLRLDAAGHIRAAYPFSAVPTPHRVRMPAGRRCSRCARSTRWGSRRCSAPTSPSPRLIRAPASRSP